jgi:beta-glucuronidase
MASTRFAVGAGLALLLLGFLGSARAADANRTTNTDRALALDRAKIEQALADVGRHAANTLLDDAGAARGDYDAVRGVWHGYETAWHTGQLVLGLVEAAGVLDDEALLLAARRGGEWWIAQQFPAGHPLAGMLNARHGGPLGDLINFTTLSDGSHGLFALSRATGDRRYADVATAAGRWALEHLYLEREGLLYNIVDPATATVWKDRSPHHPQARPAQLTQVARPNIEGSLFLDMFHHAGEKRDLDAFLRLADSTLERQHTNGFWMDFEPNDAARGKIHPRFNLWYAEALLRAYEQTRSRTYFDAALATLRATARLQREDGTLYYDSFTDGRIERDSLTGSAVAFAGLLWLEARRLGAGDEFDAAIGRSLAWVLANRFPLTHPDPNLAGAVVETWTKHRGHGIELLVRDIASAFALRFLARYHQLYFGAREDPAALAHYAGEALRHPLANVLARRRVTLDGAWQHYLDPYEVVYNKPRGRRRALPDDSRPIGNELLEYEWDTAPTITVPGDWNTQRDELRFYEGMIWYRRRIVAQPEPGERQFLYFEGANYKTTVWLNAERIGEHEGGFTPFQFEVTGKLKRGDNSIVIAVENRRERDRIPSVDFDWHNYGGITRSVHLVSVPETYLHDYRLWLDDSAAGNPMLALSAVIAGPGRGGAELRLRSAALGIERNLRADAEGRIEARMPLGAFERWSPDNPRRYEMSLQLARETLTDQIGLRTIATRGGGLLLNGVPIFLAGISVHEERLGADGGRVRSAEEARALLDAAKGLGANFVRLAHYPHNQHTLRLADEMGVLVWGEIPVYWDEIGYADTRVYDAARRQLAAMVYRDFNRAAVVLWSVANETTPRPARNAFLTGLATWVKRDDPTRLVTAALNKNPEIDRTITVTDPLGAVLDVIAVNQYEGWYGTRSPAEIDQVNLRTVWDKPLVISEFGADAPVDFRAPRETRWSVDYQAWLYAKTLELARRTPNLAGLSPWVLKDFRSPRRHHSRHQSYWNRKGLISETGIRKPAFEVLAEFYRERRDVAPEPGAAQ